MNSVFFFYTLVILIICIVTAVLAISAYASSRRRLFMYACGMFTCYTIETIEIFFYEYTSQNQVFPISEYYAVTMPIPRTLVAAGLQAFIWLMALDILDKHSKRLFAYPVAAFLAANALVLLAVPEGQLQQFLYYTLRQVFMLGVIIYMVHAYRTSTDRDFRARLSKHKRPLAIICLLWLCILIEDTYVILLAPAAVHSDWLLLYLSERNFSENILMCFFAYMIVSYAYRVLSIRIKEAPVAEEVNDLDRHVDEVLPFYREAHKLSNREAEVLRLVILGNNNQEIANELYLAVGTVKAHVHNILVKTGQKSREALILHFWQS